MRYLLVLALAFCSFAARADVIPPPTVAAKAWVLYDHGAGQFIATYNPDQRVEPASLTKLMTAYLVFSALKQKTLTLEQTVPVSEKAWKTGGSRMYIDLKQPVTVEQLLHGVIIQSGNDACIALAEAMAGSEESFAQSMNREAKRLGLKDTNFTNATGLGGPQHYSTARDLARLASAVIRDFPEFYGIYSKKEYTYNRITQPNRNRLLWMDPTIDGVKTGHTETAGFCLIGSGKRGARRLISVVMGTASETVRAQESLKLLNYGFQFHDTVSYYKKGEAVKSVRLWKGEKNELKAGFEEEFFVSVPKGQADKLKAELVAQQPLIAPISQGTRIGTLKLSLAEKSLGEYPVVALESVPLAGFFGRAWDTMRLWWQ